MNRFINNIIQDKSIQRRIFILETLSNGQEFVSTTYIAKHLHCTIRTISKDIAQLKKELPQNWEIIGVTTKGYMLIKPVTDSTFPIINSYLTQSIIYEIMISIFNNKYHTLEKWSQLLYVNKQTLKNNLKMYAHILKESNIDFTFKNLDLIGDEINIRHYYCVFFYSIQKFTANSLLPIELRKKLLSIFHSYQISMDFEALCSVIFVSMNRLFNKHLIDKTICNVPIFNNDYIEFFNAIIILIEDYFKIKLNENEINSMKLLMYFVTKNTSEQKELTIKHLSESNPKIYESYLTLIDRLISNRADSVVRNKLMFNLALYLSKIYLYNQNQLSIGYIFEPLYNINSILLQDYYKNISLISHWNEVSCDGIFNKYEIEFIATHATIILNSIIRKHILFLFSGNNAVESVLHSKLKRGLGDNVRLYRELADDVEFDFIITNYQHKISTIPTIYISEVLNVKEILAIRNCVFNNSY
ncbi:helix-turn-helix domain containing protein [Brevibacillus fortis]|uniref:helix-turn-helix domain containing protein n=1 Tax=Brevibacillus fortis TaxID=2126352 RepID=UPI002E20B2DB|nr:helix-turn-helix domain containing protein [Brevibacillus fortis]